MENTKILIVEDELLIANTLQRKLVKMGYSIVDIVSSGQKAIEVAMEEQPDLVLMDIVIKGDMNGIETAQKLYNMTRIPIIFLTAYTDENTITEAESTGAYGYLVKPFQERELSTTIRMALKKHQETMKMEQLATTDSLTGILNRRFFLQQVNKELERSQRYGNPFSLLIVDIDHFKKVNDTYGHSAGDAVIIDVTKVIQKALRKVDILGRYGGEEFIIFLPETNYQNAIHVGERIRKTIEKTQTIYENKKIMCTISLGISNFHPNDKTFDDVFKRADTALYQAKNEGRNRVIYFSN